MTTATLATEVIAAEINNRLDAEYFGGRYRLDPLRPVLLIDLDATDEEAVEETPEQVCGVLSIPGKSSLAWCAKLDCVTRDRFGRWTAEYRVEQES